MPLCGCETHRTKDGARLPAGGGETRRGPRRDPHLADGRLQLEPMGLARAVGPARWLQAEKAEPSLRELGIRGDMIRTMQRPVSAQGQERSPSDLSISDPSIATEQTIIGRVIEKGLHDELRGSAYLVLGLPRLILDGVDDLAHYLRVESIDGFSEGIGRYRKARSSRSVERRAGARTRPSAPGGGASWHLRSGAPSDRACAHRCSCPGVRLLTVSSGARCPVFCAGSSISWNLRRGRGLSSRLECRSSDRRTIVLGREHIDWD